MAWFPRRKNQKQDDRVEPTDVERVLAYHAATKHHPLRFADGPGELDWETQPDPFRRYDGAELLALDHPPPGGEPWFEGGYSPGAVPARALDRTSLSQLLLDSLGLSAWKRYQTSRWALRVNPSSGNLHPTEGTVICPAIEGLGAQPMVAHYAPKEHALELRARLPVELWQRLAGDLAPGSVLVGLSSIHWREAWKYGERAFRYCQHDVGHAIATFAVAAAALGWRARLLESIGTETLARCLGVWTSSGPESEWAECLLAIEPQSAEPVPWTTPPDIGADFERLDWTGTPNVLSGGHREWSLAREAARATRKPETVPAAADFVSHVHRPPRGPFDPISLRAVIHQRRSCLALDAKSGLMPEAFFQTLRRTLPAVSPLVFGALPWRPRVHLLLFVHRVHELEPGLYVLARDAERSEALRRVLGAGLRRERPAGCPEDLELFGLAGADVRAVAASASCQQAIAADGCFSLGMLAELEASIDDHGAWFYPRLFWECGAIGQVLYLEAEALGLRGTGIGCFFDDEVHRIFGIDGRAWQSLYHFTLGGAVEDTRLSSEPAYPSE
jgi:SagB-type dehydrogenase family enzyme